MYIPIRFRRNQRTDSFFYIINIPTQINSVEAMLSAPSQNIFLLTVIFTRNIYQYTNLCNLFLLCSISQNLPVSYIDGSIGRYREMFERLGRVGCGMAWCDKLRGRRRRSTTAQLRVVGYCACYRLSHYEKKPH